jgi:hypothetical protein
MLTTKSLVRDFRKEASKEKKMRDCGLTRLKKGQSLQKCQKWGLESVFRRKEIGLQSALSNMRGVRKCI